jgi:beta-lactamase class C
MSYKVGLLWAGMMWRTVIKAAALILAALSSMAAAAQPVYASGSGPVDSVRKIVDATIPPLMAKDGIPGMAVGVTVAGKSYVFNYGVASKKPRTAVTDDTLFEIGSFSKTFTATLASWAEVQHRLSLTDTAAKYVPQLAGTPFGNVTLLSLGTHTPGGVPLQFPEYVTNDAQLMKYLEHWHPAYPIGTYRTYSNVSIGMLGFITAKSMGEDFRSLVQQRLFPALGLKHSFIAVPAHEVSNYAWGYTAEGKPIRMAAGILSDTYGVKTTAADMIRFLQENIDPAGLPSSLRDAIALTHTGYFQAGPMTQDLIWEQYAYPVSLASLQAGNSYKMILDPNPVRAIHPPRVPQKRVLLDKTGSTNGFGTYAAFVPSERLGIVLLANRNYPIPDRVAAACRMLGALARIAGSVQRCTSR